MSTPSYDPPALDRTVRLLEKGLIGLLELPAVLKRFDSLLETLAGAVRRHNNQVTSLTTAVEEQNRLVRHLGERQECLENASQQQTALTEEHYTAHVIEPMCRQLFPLIDHIRDALVGECKDHNSRQFLEALQAQFLELLAHFGIEPVESFADDDFDPAIMRPVERLATPDSRQSGAVADVVKIGFRRRNNLLRHQSVSVYFFEPSKSSTQPSLN